MKTHKASDRSDYLKDKILQFFNNSKRNEFSLKDLLKKLGLKRKDTKDRLEEELMILVKEEKIVRTRNGLFKSNSSSGSSRLITGVIDHVNQRFAFLVPEDKEMEDLRIDARYLNGAIDGDTVKVLPLDLSRKVKDKTDKQKREGEVVEIIARKREEFVGRIDISEKFAFVIVDGRKIYFDIFVPKDRIGNAENGMKVIARVTEWPDDASKNPVGEVIDVLGKAGDNNTEMHAIMAEYGLPYKFTPELIKYSEKIGDGITPAEIGKRRDFRNITTFTIDPFDAKDFDDALSFRVLDNGNYEVGVHIADVSHYLVPDSPLDKEAYERATSVYLVDRTIPMLPERLSNELCSLRPQEEKLTFAAVFELDKNAKVIEQWFGRTVIYSDRRFTYEEAQERLETRQGDFAEELLILNDLAKKLRQERFKKGSISFESIEIKFKLDENSKPIAVIPKIRKDAHKLIEDFMLLANKKVAEHIYFMKKGKEKNTMVYRIHGMPDPNKLRNFALFARKFGHKVQIGEEDSIAPALNKLSEEIEGKPEQNVLQGLAVRCMAKAIYTTEPEPHFGLAFEHYTHFTSPIRRYPDVMVHRMLQHYLDGGKSLDKDYYEDCCEHSSEMEKKAAEAERSSIKYKQVEFMQDAKDKIFEGMISGVTDTGMYVEINETKCEGMVRLSDLTDDFYELDADNFRIVGKRNKKMFTLGDTLKVKVKKTDLARRTIDLEFVGKV